MEPATPEVFKSGLGWEWSNSVWNKGLEVSCSPVESQSPSLTTVTAEVQSYEGKKIWIDEHSTLR